MEFLRWRERYERRRQALVVLAVIGLSSLAGTRVDAFDIAGTVRDAEGRPVASAMVTVEGLGNGPATVTVFSDYRGDYRTPDVGDKVPVASLKLRVTKIGLTVKTPETVKLLPRDGSATVDFVLTKSGDVASQAPASAWLASLPIGQARYQTVLQCSGCHQFPSERVRSMAASFAGMSVQEREMGWRQIIQMMRTRLVSLGPDGSRIFNAVNITPETQHIIYATISKKDEDLIAPLLARKLPVDFSKLGRYDYGAPLGVTKQTVLKEYQLPKDSFVREVAVAPGSPYLWGADLQKNRVVRIDLQDGSIEPRPFPVNGPSGPHTIDRDSEGNLWLTNIEATEIGRLNSKTEQWSVWPGSSAGSPHDFALNWKGEVEADDQGRVWMTLPVKNQLLTLNPESGKTQEFDLPYPKDDTPTHAVVYGAAISPDRKHVWWTQLNGFLGSFDTQALKVDRVVEFPQGTGPRRLSVSEDGIVWVPLFGAGQLLKYDGKAGRELKRYNLPDRGAASYSVRWDPKRRVVWLGTTNADVIYKFDPRSERFLVYPLPRNHAYSRKLTLDEDGNIWTSYANIPTGSGPSMAVMLHPGD